MRVVPLFLATFSACTQHLEPDVAQAADARLGTRWLTLDRASASFGASVASASDVNGDGIDDIIVGAPGYDDGAGAEEGAAAVFMGSPTGAARTPAWLVSAGVAGARLGTSVASAGDVNGDGFGDVIVGAPGDYGRASVYLGSAAGLDASAAWETVGAHFGQGYGAAVASAGDVNGDGFDDVAVGEPDGLNAFGEVFVYLGSAAGLDPSPATVLQASSSSLFGASLACAGDVNGDGFDDVVVGAPIELYLGPVQQHGAAYLYLGSATGLEETEAWYVRAPDGPIDFGTSVASAGDTNGDGFDDVIIGAPYYSDVWLTAPHQGIAYLYLGAATGLGTSSAWDATSGVTQAYFGAAVAPAGDVNGDGLDDVVIGGPGIDATELASLYLGSASGLRGSARWTYASSPGFGSFGAAVAAADTTGDGSPDLVVGDPNFDDPVAEGGRVHVFTRL